LEGGVPSSSGGDGVLSAHATSSTAASNGVGAGRSARASPSVAGAAFGGPGGRFDGGPGEPVRLALGGPPACFACFFFHAITCILLKPGDGSIDADSTASCRCGNAAYYNWCS
jgi:hypothetical protein